MAENGLQLEDVPNAAPGAGQVLPPSLPPPQQLTPADATTIASIPGVDPAKAEQMRQAALARTQQTQPVSIEQPQQQAPGGPLPVQNPFGIAGSIPGTQSSSVTTTVLSPEAKKAMEKARKDAEVAGAEQVASQQEMTKVAVEKAGIQAQEKAAVAQLTQDQLEQQKTEAAQRAQASAEALRAYKQASDDFKSTRIDPNRWWNQKSTGAKIAASLASGLDAMGAAWSRSGRTPTIDRINHAIENDIESQRMAYEAKARGVQMKQTEYEMLRQAGADDATAKASIRANALNSVIQQHEADVAKLDQPEKQAQGAAQIAALKVEQARAAEQYAQLIAQQSAKHVTSSSSRTPLTNIQAAMMARGTAGGAGGQNEPILAEDLAGQGWAISNPRLAQAVINKRGMTKEVLGRMNDAQASLEAQNKLVELRKQYGAEAWNQSVKQAYEQYRETAIQKYAQSMGMPNTDATQKKLEGMFPDAAALTGPGVGGTIQGIAHGIGIGQDPVLARLEASRKESEVNFTNNLGIPGLRYVGKNAPTVVARRSGYVLMSDGSVRPEK